MTLLNCFKDPQPGPDIYLQGPGRLGYDFKSSFDLNKRVSLPRERLAARGKRIRPDENRQWGVYG